MLWGLVTMMYAQTATQKHEIQSGETLYSIARQYNVTVARLMELNPGLQADYIMAGQRINVPAGTTGNGTVRQQVMEQVRQQSQLQRTQQDGTLNKPKYKTLHEVQKKETLYSISRQHGITVDELVEANPSLKLSKLKKGVILNIPYSSKEVQQQQQQLEAQRRMEAEKQAPKVQMFPTIKVAMILPFSLSEQNMTAESQKMTNLYQGFLLAVDSLKQHGCSVEVYAYDEAVDDETFRSMMNRPVMKDMHLIVGPVRPQHILTVAQHAQAHAITHVVPLSNDFSLVNDRPTLFQINLPYSQLYSQVYNRFVVAHRDENIVFVSMNDRGDNMAYIAEFKKTLEDMGVTYKVATINDPVTILDVLNEEGRNVIIPTSGSAAAFETLCKKLDGINREEKYQLQLFGFPEWQTMAAKQEKNLSKYRCQFFTSFYSNTYSPRTQQFNSRFRRWFNQDQYSSFPRYGELGYDIGAYFLKGLKDYGSSFYENLHNYSYFSLEFPLNFEKQNQKSGYQNRSIFFITYRTDGTVAVK